MSDTPQLVIIIDFGAQYGQLIARRVRDLHVYCEIVPHTVSAAEISERKPHGLILTGGPSSVLTEDAPRLDPEIWGLGIPILGICYGMQLMAYELGGRVEQAQKREYGQAMLKKTVDSELLRDMPEEHSVWMSHGDHVLDPPAGFRVLARTDNTPVAVMGDEKRHLYGVQFHPEVVHSPFGNDMLRNFLYRVAGCRGDWTPASFIDSTVEQIRRQIGSGRAICALSGGVDSAVAAALVHRAVGSQLIPIFVDHGLLRKNEKEEVIQAFERIGMPLTTIDAAERFLSRLKGVKDPERKRKIIGEEFIRVFEEQAAKISAERGPIEFLVQGTLYPDVIESGTGQAAVIKSHHNVGGLPEDMQLKLIEPLRNLFKDEVRRLGASLGLPEEMVWRQPFPGPGLAIRVIGEVDDERLEALREADFIAREEIARAGLSREIWQYFVVLTSTRSVGVMGDGRTYGFTAALRAVTSQDGMTADWAEIPYPVLRKISNRIINEVPTINRVVYDITSKPPGTIEWE